MHLLKKKVAKIVHPKVKTTLFLGYFLRRNAFKDKKKRLESRSIIDVFIMCLNFGTSVRLVLPRHTIIQVHPLLWRLKFSLRHLFRVFQRGFH